MIVIMGRYIGMFTSHNDINVKAFFTISIGTIKFTIVMLTVLIQYIMY